MFQSAFNPKPLNVKLREQFNLPDTYKLVYIMPNERTTLIVNACGAVLFPIVVSIAALLFLAELTGRSQFSQSFDSPLSFFGFIFGWCGLMLVATYRMRSTTVSRIYHEKESGKFVLFRPSGLMRFKKEEFKPTEFLLRSDPRARKLESRFSSILTKFHGNVFINSRLRHIDFKQFSADNVVENLIGKETFKRLKNTL